MSAPVEPPSPPSPSTPAAAARLAGLLTLGEDGFSRGAAVEKLATGIRGFDHVAMGGLPVRRATAVAGQAGSAKTLFAAQFLAEGVRRGQPGVFVTLEEPARDLRTNLRTLGWDIEAWEEAGDWRFVDASPLVRPGAGARPTFSVETLAAQIGEAVDLTGAERLALDSVSAVLCMQDDVVAARTELRGLVASLRAMGVTAVLTLETPGDPGDSLSRYGIEEFVADNVVLLRNVREGSFRRRAVEVLKMRGAMHHKGDVPFTIVPGEGLVVLPVTGPMPRPSGPRPRATSGSPALDEMTGGGIFRASSALLTGPTGTGKTMLATQFAAVGARLGEKVLFMAYEETREEVLVNGAALGHDFEEYERQGLLHIVSLYPEVASLDDHLVEVQALVERLGPDRLVIDSISALERLGPEPAYRGFIIGLTSFVKTAGIVAVMTSASRHLVGVTSLTESHVSGLIDTLVVLRHVETDSLVRRGVLVLRMRGSAHDHRIRELVIAPDGVSVGEPFRGLGGVLTGQPVAASAPAPAADAGG